MAELYWIHLPEHTDMFSEGYIGITKHTALQRFRGHKKAANHTKRNTNCPIYNAIRKYGDGLLVDTLVIGSLEYVLDLEFKVRPDVKIGWNIRSGGETPRVVGTKHTESSKLKMSQVQQAVHKRPEVIEKRLNVIKDRQKPDFSYLNQEGESFKFWATRYPRGRFPNLWENIPSLWELYLVDQRTLACEAISKIPFYQFKNRHFITKIFKYFRSGWKPLEDPLYLEDFPLGT